MRTDFLESMGIVKTARKEADSIILARALLRNEPLPNNSEKFIELAKLNKVLLRTASQLGISASARQDAKNSAAEAWELFDKMSQAFEERGIPFVVIKSFDSLPDIGHDLDFLIPSPFGEEYLSPEQVLKHRRRENVNGRGVWLTSDVDGVLIRVIHAMYRHNALKLSDILDFAKMTRGCPADKVIEGIERTGTQDAFLYYLATVGRFLEACDVDFPHVTRLREQAVRYFGREMLSFFGKDRLALPYRIPLQALVMVFLFKAARDAARGRLGSAVRCLLAPPLVLLNFVNALSRDRLLKKVW